MPPLGRLPAIGRPNADILNHGRPPAYARGQAAVGGAEPWPRVRPGVLRGLSAAAGLCERRAAAASRQVALAAAKFARLWILDCTLVSQVWRVVRWKRPPLQLSARGALVALCRANSPQSSATRPTRTAVSVHPSYTLFMSSWSARPPLDSINRCLPASSLQAMTSLL